MAFRNGAPSWDTDGLRFLKWYGYSGWRWWCRWRGLAEDAKASFNPGLAAASTMPQNLARRQGLPSNNKEFREAVFSGPLDVLDTAGARATAETWFRLETPYDEETIVSWCVRAEQVEEALRFARGIRERDLAAQLLNHAAEVVLREAVNASW